MVKLYKTIKESIACYVADFLTRRALKGHWKGTRRALGTQGTWALEHLRHSALEGNFCTRTLKALGHMDTRALAAPRHSKGTQGTWVLRHISTRGTLFSRLPGFCQCLQFSIRKLGMIINDTCKHHYFLRGESHIDFRTQCVIMTQTRWPPHTIPYALFPEFRQNW